METTESSNVNKFLPQDAIREIYLAGGKIFLEAYRPKDRQSSNVKLEFEFKVKKGNNLEIFDSILSAGSH